MAMAMASFVIACVIPFSGSVFISMAIMVFIIFCVIPISFSVFILYCFFLVDVSVGTPNTSSTFFHIPVVPADFWVVESAFVSIGAVSFSYLIFTYYWMSIYTVMLVHTFISRPISTYIFLHHLASWFVFLIMILIIILLYCYFWCSHLCHYFTLYILRYVFTFAY